MQQQQQQETDQANGHAPPQKSAAGETNALNLRWCFGFNSSVANTVHSLSSVSRNALFYVTAHTGVIHDMTHDNQFLLQGHCNQITSVCVSKDKRWIATADFGVDAMIVIWDAVKASPVKIIPQRENGGVAAMDMSADAMFLVTLSYNYPQQLAVWEWPANTKTPAITAPIGNRDYQHCVRFNPVDVRDIVSNGAKEVIFWNWTEDTIAAFHPPKGITKLKKAVRNLSQTTFIPYTTKAVTATTSGHIIAWDYPVSELVQSTGRDAIKILKLVKSGINLLDTILDKFIVCGCADGAVRFFDFQFRVVAWFEDIQAGHITSISFADQNLAAQNGITQNGAPPAAQAGQVSMEEFSVPDFIVGTSQGKILQLDSKTMEHLTADKRRGKLLVQGFDEEVHALDTHPSLPLFAVGTLRGSLQIWDVDDRKMVAYRKFEIGEVSHTSQSTSQTSTLKSVTQASSSTKKTDASALAQAASIKHALTHKDELINESQQIQVVKFGPKGVLLALGFSNGFIKVVSSQESSYSQSSTLGNDVPLMNLAPPLRDICSFHRSEKSITHIVFSPDGQWIATADAEGCIAVYRYWHRDEDVEKPIEWIYVGKYRAHYQPIIEVFFEPPSQATLAAAAQAAQVAAQSLGKEGEEEKEDAGGRTGTSQSQGRNLSSIQAATSAALNAHASGAAALRALMPRLYSLGEDRILQEYDLVASSIRTGLKIRSSSRMEQTACPTAMMSLSRQVSQKQSGASSTNTPQQRDLIITANDEYKLKVWEMLDGKPSAVNNPSGASKPSTAAHPTKPGTAGGAGAGAKKPLVKNRLGQFVPADDPTLTMSPSELEEYDRDKKCRKTLLAPMYGGAISKLFNLPKREVGGSSSSNKSGIVPSEYLVYSTFQKIVGLIKLPLDGNPNKSMALIAHPGEISQVVSTFDGKYLITAGGSDRSVNLWSVATNALDASITLGGKGIEPYMSLIEGGIEGEFYQELLDYFYYAQLRNQGLNVTNPRTITGYITIDEAINLMRALGFYPTEHQIVHMKSEVRYENAAVAALKAGTQPNSSALLAASATPSPDLDRLNLDEFIKLYINHRPVYGLGPKAFEAAFETLGALPNRDYSISSETLIHQLMTLGDEPMSLEEIQHCLNALLGDNFTPHDAQDMHGRNDLSSPLKKILSRLPAQIQPQRFAQEILGFEDYSGGSGSQSTDSSRIGHGYVDDGSTVAGIEEGEYEEEEKEQPPRTTITISHA